MKASAFNYARASSVISELGFLSGMWAGPNCYRAGRA